MFAEEFEGLKYGLVCRGVRECYTEDGMGIPQGQNGDRKLLLEDIRKDAEKVRSYDSVWDMYYDEFEDAEGM